MKLHFHRAVQSDLKLALDYFDRAGRINTPMKLTTRLRKGPPYTYEFKIEVSAAERALIESASAWGYRVCQFLGGTSAEVTVSTF